MEMKWDGENWLDPKSSKEDTSTEIQSRSRSMDLKAIVSTQEGLRFFQEMMIVCGAFTEEFKGNSQTYFDQGCRAVALRYWNLIGEIDKTAQSKLCPPYDIHPYQVKQN